MDIEDYAEAIDSIIDDYYNGAIFFSQGYSF